MGWSTGSMIVSELIRNAMSNIENPDNRKSFYVEMIETFDEYDCDNLEDALGIDEVFDLAYTEVFRPIDDLEEDDG